MARSHHRPKKPHQPPQPHGKSKQKAKATPVFVVLLAVFVGGIGYFAAETFIALTIGVVVGAIIGYFIGRTLDRQPVKK